MKFFRQLIESIAPFQFIFTTIHDNSSIESFGAPEYPRNSVPTSADFHPQKTHGYTKQSADISAHSPQRAASLSEAHAHTIHHTVTPQPVDTQPEPIGFIYKPSRESTGTYLNPRTPPATPQKSVKLWRRIICGSKPTP
ncbi:unnamed protein product [Penicillium camemberti]|uniref:Str. FM013 n=1 Tax=Penicillium camemberti (strain FM 013) TaxID=1429867 RepID=A0A0G4PX12_PENC3|nr:unnamed protein product [Penicillium camemberti]